MFYSLLVVAAIAFLLLGFKRWQSLPEHRRKEGALKMLLWGSAILVLALVITGRAHWLMGVLAALIALAGRAAQLAQYIPLFKKIFGEYGSGAQSDGSSNNGNKVNPQFSMNRKEAAEILGVDVNASADDVKLAHKKLMQKIHPDRGGTDALAKQINTAKDILLS